MAACPRCHDDGDGALCSDCAPASPRETLGRALEAWRDHLPTLLLFWAIPAAVSTVTRAGVLVRNRDAFDAYASGLQDVLAGGDPAVLAEPAATLAPWLAADTAVTLVFVGAIHAVALGIARGEDPGPVPGLRVAAARLLPLLVTGVAVGLAVGLGALLLVVPGLVAFYWFLPALPAAGAGASPGEALRRSRALVRDHGSALFPVLLLFLWFGVDALAVGAADLVAGAAGFSPTSLPGVMATGLAQWIVTPVVPLYLATYHVHLEAARQRAQEAQRAEAGGPVEDVVIGQCPECGAFVPDDRTEPETEPTCPTCGYEGSLEA